MSVQNKMPGAKERMNRLRKAAKKKASMNGTIQFRVDEDTMLELMQLADRKKLPLGTMIRMWTAERLAKEQI